MYRISKVDKGWIVERLEFRHNFLGFHFGMVWKPYVKSAGLDCCWGHTSKHFAICNMVRQIQEETEGVWFEDYLDYNPKSLAKQVQGSFNE